MRDDVVEIVRSIKSGPRPPYAILVSNWSLMTEEKYLALRGAGIDQFSVSLDFPDSRHDDFRGYPGLYSQLEDLIPRLAKLGHDDIVQQLPHHGEPGRDRNHRGQSARVGRKSLL
jgi:MoaA/NifB/PqqE/SkfB family radical SAM enzyme